MKSRLLIYHKIDVANCYNTFQSLIDRNDDFSSLCVKSINEVVGFLKTTNEQEKNFYFLIEQEESEGRDKYAVILCSTERGKKRLFVFPFFRELVWANKKNDYFVVRETGE